MNTADLISALSADARPPASASLRRRFVIGLGAGALVSLALFLATVGPRPDIADAAHTVRFDLKFLDTLAMLLPSALLCLRLSRPDAEPGAMIVWLLAPAILLLAAVAAELMLVPRDLWLTRIVGTNWYHCLTLVPVFAIAPLGALIAALREGAPRHPMLTGALAGLAAAGVSATIYATNCTDDSPLFVITWYPLATGVVALAGALAGRRFLNW